MATRSWETALIEVVRQIEYAVCENCRFFKPVKGHHWRDDEGDLWSIGHCKIRFPPQRGQGHVGWLTCKAWQDKEASNE